MSARTKTIPQAPIELQVAPAPKAIPRESPTRSSSDPGDQLQRTVTGEADDALPPRDRGRKAWTFIGAAFVLETFMYVFLFVTQVTAWGYGYAFSAVLVWFQANDPWREYSLAALSAIGTVQAALQYFFPIIVVNGFRRYPEYAKPILLASAALYSLSMLAASWSTTIYQLVLLQGVVCGMTGAVLYAPVVMHLNSWFVERRGLASGIIFAGTGIGGATFPFLLSKLLDNYGFSGMCRVWAAIVGVASIGSVLVLQPRNPPVKPKGKREKWFLLDLRILKSSTFWIMAVAAFSSSLSYFPVSLYLATYTSSVLQSSSLLLPSVVVAVFNASAFVGSTVIGAAADRSVAATIIGLGLVGTIYSVCGWGLSDSLPAVLVFAVLYGFGSRITAYFGPGAKLIAGSNPHASTTILCFFSIARGIAAVAGPFIATGLYRERERDSEGKRWGRYGFEGVIIFVGVMSFCSAVAGGALKIVRKKGYR